MKGKIYLLLSAFIYGILPVMAKIAYTGGAMSITVVFLRASMSLPLLYGLMRIRGETLRLNKLEAAQISLLGTFGGALPIILLYISYDFISAGLATTLHFIYPIVIVLAEACLYRERMSAAELIAALAVTAGVFMFSDISTGGARIGIAAALLSGIMYSFFVVYTERSGLDRMDCFKLAFYVQLISAIGALVFGITVGGIGFSMSGKAWVLCAVISVLTSLGALPLFQAGIRREGAVNAGLISALEPVTGIVAGNVVLGEEISAMQLVGAVLIILGICAVQAQKSGKN